MWPGGPTFEPTPPPIIVNDDSPEIERTANPEAFAVEFEARGPRMSVKIGTLWAQDRRER